MRRPGHARGARLITRNNSNKARPPSLQAQKAWKAVGAVATIVLVLTPYLQVVRIGLADDSARQRTRDNASSSLPGSSINDICRVAKAMERSPLQFASYTAKGAHDPIGWPKHIPHVSSLMCNRMNDVKIHQRDREITTAATAPDTVHSIISFKSARSGSTFFTSVVVGVLQRAGRPTKKYWEPSFCSNLHKHGYGIYREAPYQAASLRKMLTSKCTIDPDFGCQPAGVCRKDQAPLLPAERGGEPAYIVALNPRFLNQSIDWAEVLGGMGDTLRVFSLRRTNLILMAYSKFHHGGCKVGKDFHRILYDGSGAAGSDVSGGTRTMSDEEKLREQHMTGKKRNFSFATMLQCIHHYAIGDQELSMSTAFSAAAASKSNLDPYLVLYEDVLASGSVVQDGMLRHLGLVQDERAGNDTRRDGQASGGNFFQINGTATTKVHSDSLCSYADVDCAELEAGLKAVRPDGAMMYPCLWKQYSRADEGLSWSVPLLRSGLVSLEGDCFSLEAISRGDTDETRKKKTRSVKELYRLYVP